jgi:ferric-dicitrate binding protein FerR (iron transport regulator)
MGERVAKKGEWWQRGETLKTLGPNSAVTVTFGDETRLDFDGNSVAVNQSTKEQRRVELERGAVQGVIKRQPAGLPFVFASSEAEAMVVGTTLRFIADAHQTRLEVSEGEVRFHRKHDGAEVTVKAGHVAVVAPNVPFVATPIAADPHHP